MFCVHRDINPDPSVASGRRNYCHDARNRTDLIKSWDVRIFGGDGRIQVMIDPWVGHMSLGIFFTANPTVHSN